jgi:hypothetical protein
MSIQSMRRVKALLLVVGLMFSGMGRAEVCTTQSKMKDTDWNALNAAVMNLATKVQANDVAGLRDVTVPELSKDFGGIGNVVGSTAAKVKDGTLSVEQIFLLDGTELKRGTDGGLPDAQFYCSLSGTSGEVDFLIPQLPPGRYGFAIVDSKGAEPWRLSFLLREEQGKWAMAGFYPRVTMAAGHDGLWYWTQARQMAKSNERWNAWLYYQQAEALLKPVNFISSSHLEKLRTEATSAAPPSVSEGVSASTPLVVKGTDGVEYKITGLSVDDSLGKERIDVVVHAKADSLGDLASQQKFEKAVMGALLGAYPELRKAFHGVWVFAEAPGHNPGVLEQAMADIH